MNKGFFYRLLKMIYNDENFIKIICKFAKLLVPLHVFWEKNYDKV